MYYSAFNRMECTVTTYADIGRKQFQAAIAPSMTLEEIEFVMAAYAFYKGAHNGVMRADGTTRYFEHPSRWPGF